MISKAKKEQLLETKGLPPKPEAPALTPEQTRQRQIGQLLAVKGQLTRVIEKASQKLRQVDMELDAIEEDKG